MIPTIFTETVTMNQLINAAFIIAAIVLAGIVFDKLMIVVLKRLVIKTKWMGDDIIVGALQKIITWLALIIGIYAGSRILPIIPEIMTMINKLFWVLLITWTTIYVGRVFVRFIQFYATKNTGLSPNTSILSNITRIIIFSIGFLSAIQSLGISITPLLTALGVGGLAVALALQNTLSNLFAGIQLLAAKYIHTGDYVKLDTGDEGYITDITWRSTSIRALPNRIIVVPNTVLANSIVNNYTLPEKEIAVLLDMSVAYNSDLKKVERVTIEVASETMKNVTGGIPAFTPLVRFNTFADSGIGFTVVMRAEEFVNQYIIKHEFIKAIHARYKKEHIEIPYPVRVVKMERV